MNSFNVWYGTLILGLALWPSMSARAMQQEKSAADKAVDNQGVEVEARGQVHEAFAAPALERQSPAPLIHKKPPEPLNELPPDQKPQGENIQWIPGYWMWDEDRSDFLWVSGTWRNMPPDKRWLPGYWSDADGGYRWVSGYWMDQGESQVTLYPEPPAPVEEAMPAIESDQSYVPGIWVYRNNQYWWRPGFRITLRPDWIWTPASYRWTPGGYVFVDGYWDYDLARRGFAFAPVYVNFGINRGADWAYRPSYVISTDFLLGSLFVHAGWNHYYFGDYYDSRYGRLGYSPWTTYRYHNRLYDPLFSYYRWEHRSDPRWERNLQNVYASRRDNASARPARTLTALNKSAGDTKERALVSLNQWKGEHFNLERQNQSTDRQTSNHYRQMGAERIKNETSQRRSLYPPDKQSDKDTPPVKSEAKKDSPENSSSTAPISRRYEIPHASHTYHPQTGKMAPPKRPAHPQPVQRPAGRRNDNPGKK